jgi:mannose-1-phosphate guanylyltransferase
MRDSSHSRPTAGANGGETAAPVGLNSPVPPRRTTYDFGKITGSKQTGAGVLEMEEPEPDARRITGESLWAVVLAGGIGSRFWPISSPRRPKPLLQLTSERPLIAETLRRLSPLVPAERVLVVTSADIADAIQAVIPEVPRRNLLVEPRPLGTAAALAWATEEIVRRAGPDTIFCCVHADLAVGFPELFRATLLRAARLASMGQALVAIGVRASRAESAFGYLQPGARLRDDESLESGGGVRVTRFIEKPDADEADRLVRGGALWNTGIFVWRAAVVREALESLTPEVAPGLPALRANEHAAFVAGVRSVSIEHGLLERSDSIVAMLGDFEWDDVGTWASLRRARELDDRGNGAVGGVHFVECTGNVVHSEGVGGDVVLYGVEGLLVVALDGLTFVTTMERAADLRPLLDALPAHLRNRQA